MYSNRYTQNREFSGFQHIFRNLKSLSHSHNTILVIYLGPQGLNYQSTYWEKTVLKIKGRQKSYSKNNTQNDRTLQNIHNGGTGESYNIEWQSLVYTPMYILIKVVLISFAESCRPRSANLFGSVS